MSLELEKFQINYDQELKQLIYKTILLKKIKAKIDELSADPEAKKNQALTLYRAIYRTQVLRSQIDTLKDYIHQVTDNHTKISPYHLYKDDLKANMQLLIVRKKHYQSEFEKLELVTTDTDKIPVRPKHWSLPIEQAEQLKPFRPKVTPTMATHNNSKQQHQTVLAHHKSYNYSFTEFCYADDGTVINERFILFWMFDQQGSLVQQSNDTGKYRPHNLQVGLTNSVGNLFKLHCGSDTLKDISKADEMARPELKGLHKDDDYSAHRYELTSQISKQAIANKYTDYYLSNTHLKIKELYGFMLYPLDQGAFITKDLNKLASMAAPSYPSKLEEQKLVFSGGQQQAPTKAYLHCTLPEWNSRLRTSLNDIQQQINEFNTVMGPHHVKRQQIKFMIDIVDLHRRHPSPPSSWSEQIFGEGQISALNRQLHLNSSDYQQQKNNKQELHTQLLNLDAGICSISDTPNMNNGATTEYYYQKQDIDKSAAELWNLLSSPALKAELKLYIEHLKTHFADIKDEDIKEGEIPPGPYMDRGEQSWYQIFTTIAECYAALSASDTYAKIVWDKDIVHGLETLAKFDLNDEVNKEISQVWTDMKSSVDDNEFNLIPNAIRNQAHKLENKENNSIDSLLKIILDDYNTIIKPFIGQLIPGAGAPGTLQVVLASYDSFVTSHIKQKIQTDITYHVRFFSNVLKVFNIVNSHEPDHVTIAGKKVSDIFKAFIVTKDIRKSNIRAAETSKALKQFFAGIDESETDSKNQQFFDKFDNKPAGFAKVTYGLFNLAVSIQYLKALEESAIDKNWSIGRYKSEYIKAWGEIMLASGSQANTIGLMVARFNLSQRLVTNPSNRALLSSIAGNFGQVLNQMAVALGLVQSIFSALDAIEHFNNAEYAQMGKNAVISAGLFMLSAGYGIRSAIKSGAVLAAREAGLLTVPGAAAATGIGSVIAGIFITVGTVINLTMFAWEMGNIMKTLLASSSQKLLVNSWNQFKSPLPYLTNQQITDLKLVIRYPGSHNDYSLIDLYNIKPFDCYSKAENWNYEHRFLTQKPIEIIEDIHSQDIAFDNDSVELGQLSWRAIIPLHKMGIEQEQIEAIVQMPNFGTFSDFIGLKTVKDIMDYYKLTSKEITNKLNSKQQFMIEGKNKQFIDIPAALESGDFSPPPHDFYLAKLWQHPVYQIQDVNEIEE